MAVKSRRGLGPGRASLGAVDQGLSSLTNLGASVVAARTLSAEQFGAFSVAFVTYVLCLGTVRALVSEPLTVRAAASADLRQRDDMNAACGVVALLALWAALLTFTFSLFLPGALRGLGVALAVLLPGLLIQDMFRFVSFVQSKPASALINDGIWLICVACGLIISHGRVATPTSVLIVWGSGASVAAVIAMARSGVVPAWRDGVHWLRHHFDLSSRFLAEFVAAQGSGQLTFYLVGVVAGLSELASLRGAHLLYGPFHVAMTSLRLMIPDLVKLRSSSEMAFRRSLERQTMLLIALAPMIWVTLTLLPDSLGTIVLGETWAGARNILIPVGLQKLGLGAAVGAFCGLRVLTAAGESLRMQITTSALTLIAGALGAGATGASGAAWGMACAQVLGAVLCWRTLARTRMAGHLPIKSVQ